MEVGAVRGCRDGKKVGGPLVDGMIMFKILNIERVPKVICFVLACNKQVLAPQLKINPCCKLHAYATLCSTYI